MRSVYKFVRTVYENFVSKPKSIYKQGIHMLSKRWQLVIDNEGKYIITDFMFTFLVEKSARTYGLT